MNYVVFENNGEIDPRSITTFGISSKENKNPIGFFGTGLKYAISILLRNGHEISIQSGGRLYKFDTVTDVVRVDTFEFVRMNEQLLGFTTELGKNWEIWQAVREILCNCMDENGTHELVDKYPDYKSSIGKTRVIVAGTKFIEEYHHRDNIVLNKAVLYEDAFCSVHPGPSSYIYYRGIRVCSTNGLISKYTYNIKANMTLTEDRTLSNQYYAKYYIAKTVENCKDKTLISNVICASDIYYEKGLEFHSDHSDEFLQCVLAAKKRLDRTLNRTALDATKMSMLDVLEDAECISLNTIDAKRLYKAILFSKKIGFNVDDYPIIVLETLGDGILGRAHKERIFLSMLVFNQGTKQVASTLIEEYIHLKHGFFDLTYEMQTFLFDTICSLGEQATGELL